MIELRQIESIVHNSISNTDIYIVDITITASNNIIVRLDSYTGISIETCTQVLRQIESVLNRDIEDYSLEVTSAGVGEPFKVRQQYIKMLGHQIEVILKDGRKLVEKLCSVDDDGITITQSKVKYSKNAIKMLSKEQRAELQNEQNDNIKISWDEIKASSEYLNFQ